MSIVAIHARLRPTMSLNLAHKTNPALKKSAVSQIQSRMGWSPALRTKITKESGHQQLETVDTGCRQDSYRATMTEEKGYLPTYVIRYEVITQLVSLKL